MTDSVGKVFKAERGMRRCQVCEELLSREAAAAHASAPLPAEARAGPRRRRRAISVKSRISVP